MKRLLHKVLAVVGLVLVLWPAAGMGNDDTMQLPIGKRVDPGTSFVQYGGQTFRFATAVSINVSFEMVSATQIRLKFVAPAGVTNGHIAIFWMDFQSEIYEGNVPVGEPWDGVLNTESGFVDR